MAFPTMIFERDSTMLNDFSHFCSTFQSPQNKKNLQISTFLSQEEMKLV